jgi:signal peptidase I
MKLKEKLCRLGQYWWREWIRPTALVAAIVFPFKSAIADWNWVPTGSMKPTILEGDLVLVNKLAYDFKVPFTLQRLASWSDPAHDDIVVFFSPFDGVRLVKRVVALPGDTLELRDNVLYRNGQAMTYEAATAQSFAREIHEDVHAVVAREFGAEGSHWVMALPSRKAVRSFPPVTVPAGKYFVMGDSRDNSFDSRYFGFVERERIVGRSQRVLLSFDKNHSYVPRVKRSFSVFDAQPQVP